jgi:hypothetical protein
MKKCFIMPLLLVISLIFCGGTVQSTELVKDVYHGETVQLPVEPYPVWNPKTDTIKPNKIEGAIAKGLSSANNANYTGYYLLPEQASNRDIAEGRIWRRAGFAIVCMLVFLFYVLFGLARAGVEHINKNYVEPARKRHENTQKQYRKYLIDCDKRGKPPLSYKQWKFAYIDKKAKK